MHIKSAFFVIIVMKLAIFSLKSAAGHWFVYCANAKNLLRIVLDATRFLA